MNRAEWQSDQTGAIYTHYLIANIQFAAAFGR